MVERVLCAFFPGLKGQNLLFQGTSSSKDMASAVMKGIELDTFVRTHIWYIYERESEQEGEKTWVFFLCQWKTYFLDVQGFFPGWSQLGRASPLHKTRRLNAIAEWIWGINPLELVDSDPYSKLDKTSETFLPGSEPKEWALSGQHAEGREISSVCTQTARTQGLMEQSFWGKKEWDWTFLFLGQIHLRNLLPPKNEEAKL